MGEKSLGKKEELLQDRCLVLSDHPRFTFSRILNALFVEREAVRIHPTAVIDPRAEIAGDVSIGPYACIGKGVIISAGCTIGAAGFGYVKNESGTYEAFPQLGGVQIRDNVEIGANTTIDRGTLSDTIINEGVKIDNLVRIGDGVTLGIGGVAMKSIPEGETWNGSPARPVDEYIRQQRFLKKQSR
jgi:UDP-3-O-[3-hydroxymyristoyl] glucosamine N-acyltransferase